MTNPVPALEIGGTHVSAALVDTSSGQRHGRTVHTAPLRSDGNAEELLSAIATCARSLMPGVSADARWGVALPGPFDYRTGVGEFTSTGKFHALAGVDLGAALRTRLGAAVGDIVFSNDAHAFGRGECQAGAARHHRRVMGITLGTGIGSVFLDNGAIVDRGPRVPPLGRADLIRVSGVPLEDLVSRNAILGRYSGAPGTGDQEFDVVDIAQRARTGDREASEAFRGAFLVLGEALRPWVDSFRPSMVVVGGSIAESWDLVLPALQLGLGMAAETGDIAIRRSSNTRQSALIGAALWAEAS